MRKALRFTVLLVSASYCLAQSKPGAIGISGVWQVPQNFVATLNSACGASSQERKYADCFTSQMSKAGAPTDAVAFTRELFGRVYGGTGRPEIAGGLSST